MFKLPDEIKLGLAICILAGITGAQKVDLGVNGQRNKSQRVALSSGIPAPGSLLGLEVSSF